MGSNFLHSSSSNLSKLDFLTINLAQLEIASHLYPNILGPHKLTSTHIAAIRINIVRYFANSPFFRLLRKHTTADYNPKVLIYQAKVYGEYHNYLTKEEQSQVNIESELYKNLLKEIKEMDFTEFNDCVSNWFFIEKLEREGEMAAKKVLVKGWIIYKHILGNVKQDLGLLNV